MSLIIMICIIITCDEQNKIFNIEKKNKTCTDDNNDIRPFDALIDNKYGYE